MAAGSRVPVKRLGRICLHNVCSTTTELRSYFQAGTDDGLGGTRGKTSMLLVIIIACGDDGRQRKTTEGWTRRRKRRRRRRRRSWRPERQDTSVELWFGGPFGLRDGSIATIRRACLTDDWLTVCLSDVRAGPTGYRPRPPKKKTTRFIVGLVTATGDAYLRRVARPISSARLITRCRRRSSIAGLPGVPSSAGRLPHPRRLYHLLPRL